MTTSFWFSLITDPPVLPINPPIFHFTCHMERESIFKMQSFKCMLYKKPLLAFLFLQNKSYVLTLVIYHISSVLLPSCISTSSVCNKHTWSMVSAILPSLAPFSYTFFFHRKSGLSHNSSHIQPNPGLLVCFCCY
jgi:hypothetical protein